MRECKAHWLGVFVLATWLCSLRWMKHSLDLLVILVFMPIPPYSASNQFSCPCNPGKNAD